MRPGSGLLTDLYELTMAASYHRHGLDTPATFDLFVRSLPRTRSFLVACGLETALDHLEALSFEEDELAYLEGLDLFDAGFLDRLGGLRFTGDVWAVPEGEVVFAGEPLLRVTAPLVEAQVVETALLNLISHATMVASKAARVSLAARGRRWVDFGARRSHGPSAAHLGARAAYVGGASATSMVTAGRAFGIPVSGTMAHSYVMRFASEVEAFRTFAHDHPSDAVLLIDTYDTVTGARRAVAAARELAADGIEVRAVRLDSGDLGSLSREVRAILDGSGFETVRILASGDLDEHRVAELVESGAPVDAFGVGTRLVTSDDAPSLGAVYKLVDAVDGPKAKTSQGKVTWPGRKQIWRRVADGVLAGDVLGLDDEDMPGEPLLAPVMAGGRRTDPSPPLERLRERAEAGVSMLPPALRALHPGADPYPVEPSARLRALAEQTWEHHG